ncbi:MAG: Gfo/Idh/MocA family protein [Limnochordia bacterium]|jgi:predicted dehydrogenase
MAKDLVRVGMVGAGSISGSHLAAAREGAGAKVVAVCDIIEERARRRAAEFNIPEVYTDHRRMLEESDLDAVIVGVPNNVHHEITINALKAGKHVLCEKPMAINVAAGEQMVAAAKESGRILAVGLVNRMRSEVQTLRAMVDSDELGKIYYAKAMMIRRKGIPGWGSWFTRKEESGGGPLIDIGVHALDLAWFLIGCPKPVSVTGHTYTAFGPDRRGLGSWGIPDLTGFYDVEDLAVGMIRFDNGAAINLEVSWALNMPPETRINVIGEKAGALCTLDGNVRFFSEVENELVDTTRQGSKVSIFRAQLQHFTDAIREGTPVLTPGEHGLTVTRMLEGIYESAASGKEIRLD